MERGDPLAAVANDSINNFRVLAGFDDHRPGRWLMPFAGMPSTMQVQTGVLRRLK